MAKKIITNDNILWQKRINEIFRTKKKEKIDIFFYAVSLILTFSTKNKEMLELYKLVGLDTFTKIINFFDGKIVKFFKSKDFKEAMMLSLFYYLRYVENKSWDEIKKELPFNVKSIRYGIRLKKLNDFVKEELNKLFSFWEEQEELNEK